MAVAGLGEPKDRGLHAALLLEEQLLRHVDDEVQPCSGQDLAGSLCVFREGVDGHDDDEPAAFLQILNRRHRELDRIIGLVWGLMMHFEGPSPLM